MRKSSSNDNGREHAYLANIPEQLRIKSEIRRGAKIEGGGNKWVQIIQNNIVTYDSRKQ